MVTHSFLVLEDDVTRSVEVNLTRDQLKSKLKEMNIEYRSNWNRSKLVEAYTKSLEQNSPPKPVEYEFTFKRVDNSKGKSNFEKTHIFSSGSAIIFPENLEKTELIKDSLGSRHTWYSRVQIYLEGEQQPSPLELGMPCKILNPELVPLQ